MSVRKRREGPLCKVMTCFPKLIMHATLDPLSLENGEAVGVLHLVLNVLGEITWLLPYLLLCCVGLVMERTEVSLGCAEDHGRRFSSCSGAGEERLYLMKAKCLLDFNFSALI